MELKAGKQIAKELVYYDYGVTDEDIIHPIVVIHQGKPSSPFFHIIQPVPGKVEFHAGQEIHCINPKTGVLTKGIITKDCWVFPWDEAPEAFVRSIYGLPVKLVRTALIASDPQFRQKWCRIMQIREIKIS